MSMASLIPGFEYDVFISYRLKKRKGEREKGGRGDMIESNNGIAWQA
jgi:hypothetical protein